MARAYKRQQQRDTVAIVGDGQTERLYFSDVRDTDRPPNLSIFPDYPRRVGNFVGVLRQATLLTENYNRVYALIDMDKVVQDGQQAAYLAAKTLAQENGVIVLENNPCFETWLLLHFLHTGRLFNNCGEVSAELRKEGRIPGYDKTERFLVKTRLYKTFKSQLIAKAIPNAKLLEQARNQDHLFPRAETFHFFEWYLNNNT